MPESQTIAIQKKTPPAQRPAGNGPAFFSPLLQPKLVINPPNDAYEKEADAVADQVMRMPAEGSSFFQPRPFALKSVQRKCAACEEEENIQKKQADNPPVLLQSPIVNGVQRKCRECAEEEGEVQRQSSGANSSIQLAPPSVAAVTATSGTALEGATRQFMEARFGYDFRGVRIHNDRTAHHSSADIGAKAYTQGNHIVFGHGYYQPHTKAGQTLLAHELSHTIQQGASTAPVVQREVEPVSISAANDVLGRIKKVESEFSDKSPKLANLLRLDKLGFKEFNPGAPGAAGPTNAFVYTCRCGWIDLGHFLVSAAVAYKIAFLKQFDLRVNDVPYELEDLLTKGLDKSEAELEQLINTVPGNQGGAMLARVRELIATGNPAALSLSLGYATEFYQQAAKLVADRMKKVPKALEGEQRSAFTIEDLSSDCYGADRGYKIWKAVAAPSAVANPQLIQDSVKQLFDDCKAVFPTGKIRDAMMEETTPGSVSHIAGEDERGIPMQDQNMDAPNLLSSAQAIPECKGTSPLLCEIGKGKPLPKEPLPEITLNISSKDKTITVVLPQGSGLGNESKLPGTAILKIGADGKLTGAGKLSLPGIGVMDASLITDLDLGKLLMGEVPRIGLGLRDGPVEMNGEMKISYDGLERMLKGPLAAEAKKFREILQSDQLRRLVTDYFNDKINTSELKKALLDLVKEKYPGGMSAALTSLAEAFVMDIILHTKLDFFGVTSISGIPIAATLFQKRDPLKIAGNDAPVFRFAQGGLQIPQVLKARIEQQYGLVFGYSEDWLIGDPRPGGPGLHLGFTAGLGLPQAELYVEGHASAADDKGFELSAGFHYARRFGSREPLKPPTVIDFRHIPEEVLKGPQWDVDPRTGAFSAYARAGTKRLNLSASFTVSPQGTKEFWLVLGGTHSIAGSKGAGVR